MPQPSSPHRITRAAAALAIALAVNGVGAGTAAARDAAIHLSGVIAVEQSRTPAIPEDGVALVRTDGRFVSSDDWGIGGFPDLSPAGTLLATSHEGCVFFTKILVAPNPYFAGSRCRFGSEPKASEPAWAPDGRHVAFVGETTVAGRSQWDIYVMKADETGVRRITGDGRRKSDPQWRVDGRIAFVLDPGDGSPTDIYSVRWDAASPGRPARETTGTDAKFISFPDHQYGIGASAYISSASSNSVPDRLYVRGREVLSRPTWSLRGVAWEPGPTPDHLVVAVDAGGADELLIVDRSGEIERRLPVANPRNPDWRVDAHARPGGISGVRAGRTGEVPLDVHCPDAVDCRVTVGGSATAVGAKRARAAAAGRRAPQIVTLATRRYTVPASTSHRVRYRLPAAARRLLREHGRLRARFEVTVTGTRARRQVRRVTVLPARPPR